MPDPTRTRTPRRRALTAAAALTALVATVAPAGAAATSSTSSPADCSSLLAPNVTVAGYSVGETSCQITGTSKFTDDTGGSWTEQDLAVSGTAAGYVDPATTTANFRMDLTDVPDILFPQFGIPTWVPAEGSYSGGTGQNGAGLSVLYPNDPAAWNGKDVLIMHGQSNDTPIGPIVPQQAGGPLPEDTFDNLFADEWVDAGYAVIYVRRPAASGVTATTADGTAVPSSLNDNIHMVEQLLATGQKLLTGVLGRPASTTYEYGHSAGTIWAELDNESGFNTLPSGAHVISGFVFDDPGGGLPLPLSMAQGNVLGDGGNWASYPPGSYLPQSIRRQMVPGIVLAHADYLSTHTWLPTVTYLDLKQEAQQLYIQEGLGEKVRTYVIAGVSHISNSTGSPPGTLDYGLLMQSVIPMLNAWVTKATAPPPSIAGPPGDTSVNQQLQLPDIACPMGIRYPWPYPDGGPTETGFVPYGNGTTLEPINSQGVLVTVNGAGYRTTLPSLDQAWAQLGLIGRGQSVTAHTYQQCVAHAAAGLQAQHLLSAAAVAQYTDQALAFPNVQ
ncbi:MAG TPA: hypothetical protein VGM10_00980 [Actinocrinis sp.]